MRASQPGSGAQTRVVSSPVSLLSAFVIAALMQSSPHLNELPADELWRQSKPDGESVHAESLRW
jgi:hypothetical protein